MAGIINFNLPPSVEGYLISKKSKEVISILRSQKINIPKQVKKVYVCKENIPYTEVNGTLPDNLEGFTCLQQNCVLIDDSCNILGILVHNFYENQIATGLFDKVHNIYKTGGEVNRGKTKKGKRMVMCGYRWDNFIEGIHR